MLTIKNNYYKHKCRSKQATQQKVKTPNMSLFFPRGQVLNLFPNESEKSLELKIINI